MHFLKLNRLKNHLFLIFLLLALLGKNNSYSQEKLFLFTTEYGVNKLFSDISSNSDGSGGIGFYSNPVSAFYTGISFNLGSFTGQDKGFIYNATKSVYFLTTFYEYNINENYSLSLEPTYTWCNTDKLDYISVTDNKDSFLFFPPIF